MLHRHLCSFSSLHGISSLMYKRMLPLFLFLSNLNGLELPLIKNRFVGKEKSNLLSVRTKVSTFPFFVLNFPSESTSRKIFILHKRQTSGQYCQKKKIVRELQIYIKVETKYKFLPIGNLKTTKILISSKVYIIRINNNENSISSAQTNKFWSVVHKGFPVK